MRFRRHCRNIARWFWEDPERAFWCAVGGTMYLLVFVALVAGLIALCTEDGV
jgi:hypothetical protein